MYQASRTLCLFPVCVRARGVCVCARSLYNPKALTKYS